MSGLVRERLVVAGLFAAGFIYLFRDWLFSGFDRIFGDDSDGEIFIAIVEHWYRVFRGDAHWPDPIFFYPEAGTLGFTDAAFFYGIVHAAARAIGADPFTAYMIVMAGLAVIGFFAFLRLAHRHFSLPLPIAGIGAFLFAFANLNATSLIHGQIYCAMLLPALCDLTLTAWKEEKAKVAALLAAPAGLLHALVFLTGYQVAWFFTFLALLFALLHPLVLGPSATRMLVREAFTAKRAMVASYAAAFAIGLIPFLKLYMPVLFSGRSREFAEVAANAPGAGDILNVTPSNMLWGDVLQAVGITGRPDRPWWEVDLGFTPVVFGVLLATTLLLALTTRHSHEPAGQRDRWLLVLAAGVLLSWLLQLDYFGFRPWKIVWGIVPGAGAMRYTFRSQAVANLFAMLVVARGFEALSVAGPRRVIARVGFFALACVALIEQVNLQWPPTISRRATSAWIDAVPPPPSGCSVFYLAPGLAPVDRAGWIHQADAMLFSQIRNIPTVNGYSSWLPEGWNLEEPSSPGYAAAVRQWADARKVTGLCGLDLGRGVWTVGLP